MAGRTSIPWLECMAGSSDVWTPIAASDGSDAFARCARLVPKLVPLFGMCSQPMRRYNGISGAVELR
eukprot:scaffold79353_cov63-Phaeocystis_antarctica.AAC.1